MIFNIPQSFFALLTFLLAIYVQPLFAFGVGGYIDYITGRYVQRINDSVADISIARNSNRAVGLAITGGGGTGTPQFSYDFPSSGSITLTAPWGLGVGTVPLQYLYITETFAQSADKSIYVSASNSFQEVSTTQVTDPNPPNDVTVTKRCNILLNGDAPDDTYFVDVIAKDTCDQSATFHLTYTKRILYWYEVMGWPWYVVEITYQVN